MVRLLLIYFSISILLLVACTNGQLTTSAGGTATNLGFQKALSFNGSTDGVLLANAGTTIGAQYTVEANIILMVAPSTYGVIFSRRNGSTVNWWLAVTAARYLEARSYTVGCAGNNQVTSVSSPLNIGQKYHVAASTDGSTMWIYLDGTLIHTAAAAAASCTVTNQGIGYDHWGGGNFFTGTIDNLRVSTFGRYTGAGFIPPTAPYTYAGEYLLYTFDYLTTSGSVTTATNSTTFSFVGAPNYINSPFP